MLFVICYDVSDDRRRRRLERVLRDFAHRVQYSVFEGEMDEARFQKMRRRAERQIDPQQDSLRYYRLCKSCRSAVEVYGLGPLPQEPESIIVV